VMDSRDVILWDVETHTQIAQFKFSTSDIQRLVFSPDHSRLAALTPDGLEFFDIINKCAINPRHEEISWIFHNGTLMSKPTKSSRERGYGLLGHFTEHCDRVPILWIPRDVGISAFTFQSSTFALGCDDGRLMIGRLLATS